VLCFEQPRGKAPDLCDIWLLLTQGVEPDLPLGKRKLALYTQEWERHALEEATENLRAERERGLRPLLPQFMHYGVARQRVEAWVE